MEWPDHIGCRAIVLQAPAAFAPQRDHMLLDTELDEAMLQLDQNLFSDSQLTEKAWLGETMRKHNLPH